MRGTTGDVHLDRLIEQIVLEEGLPRCDADEIARARCRRHERSASRREQPGRQFTRPTRREIPQPKTVELRLGGNRVPVNVTAPPR